MIDEATRRLWSDWVDRQIGGDEWRKRSALEAALQSLQMGRSASEATAAAHAAVGPMTPAVTRCRFCGSTPALAMTMFEHNGFLVVMQFKHLNGPFCRSCGLHVWRRMTDTTLWRGWWGFISFFAAPVTVLINLANLPRLKRLPPPNTATAGRPPADPGPGMFRRPGVYVYGGLLLVLFILFALPSVLVR